ncbi:hypothetical protein NA57DRAFT_73563 [Rhizodiscina lignyota]|uniref:Cyclin-dependent kinase n=1 Tax=Rhizodiscina lignyota TaxID=1504668 RepID=A0A9P4II79_9PEZI|nr:hypothetical protein NA57DRAFT_73563 [Rhizodiscina lignyota]
MEAIQASAPAPPPGASRDANASSREPASQYPAGSSASPTPKVMAAPQQVSQLTPPPQSPAKRKQNAPAIAGAGSQESVLSDFSMGGSIATAPGLQSSSSNLSNSTIPESEFTSPASSVGMRQEILNAQREAAMAAAAQLNNVQAFPLQGPRTPDADTEVKDGTLMASSVTSPMAIDTPYLHQASKRTASGTIKPTAPSTVAYAGITAGRSSPPKPSQLGHSRSQSSVDGLNKAKIAEISAQLKTRLSYAMVKVQNGWEKRSIEDLENQITSPSQLSNSRKTPSTPTPTGFGHFSRPSTSSIGGPMRNYDATYSAKTQRYAHSPDVSGRNSPPGPGPALLRRTTSSSSSDAPISSSPRTYAAFFARHGGNTIPASSAMRTHAHTASTSTITSTTPSLGPPVDLVPSSTRPGRSGSASHPRRSHSHRAPPNLSGSSRKMPYASPSKSQMLTSPTTPTSGPLGGLRAGVTPRPLRMPSQQAEKDAVDTLLFMSSPNNSSNMKHIPGSQGSPLRSEFPPGLPR